MYYQCGIPDRVCVTEKSFTFPSWISANVAIDSRSFKLSCFLGAYGIKHTCISAQACSACAILRYSSFPKYTRCVVIVLVHQNILIYICLVSSVTQFIVSATRKRKEGKRRISNVACLDCLPHPSKQGKFMLHPCSSPGSYRFGMKITDQYH